MLTIILIVFGGGGLVLIGALVVVAMRNEVGERLGEYATIPDANPQRAISRRQVPINRLRLRLNSLMSAFVSEALNLQLMSANWPITETEYLLIRFWVTVAGFLLGWVMFQSILSGIGLGIIAYLVPAIVLRRSILQRRTAFERQLIDVLVLMTGSVRAGYSLPQSLEFIIKEMPAPSSEEFKRVQYEVSLGLPLNQALSNLVKRMQNDDLYLLVTAININAQVGGNLVTMLKSVTDTIRDRIRLFAEVRALTSQQRFNAWLLTLLPFAFAGIMFFMNSDYIMRLFQPGIWLCFPIGAFVNIMIGNVVIRRLARIEV